MKWSWSRLKENRSRTAGDVERIKVIACGKEYMVPVEADTRVETLREYVTAIALPHCSDAKVQSTLFLQNKVLDGKTRVRELPTNAVVHLHFAAAVNNTNNNITTAAAAAAVNFNCNSPSFSSEEAVLRGTHSVNSGGYTIYQQIPSTTTTRAVVVPVMPLTVWPMTGVYPVVQQISLLQDNNNNNNNNMMMVARPQGGDYYLDGTHSRSCHCHCHCHSNHINHNHNNNNNINHPQQQQQYCNHHDCIPHKQSSRVEILSPSIMDERNGVQPLLASPHDVCACQASHHLITSNNTEMRRENIRSSSSSRSPSPLSSDGVMITVVVDTESTTNTSNSNNNYTRELRVGRTYPVGTLRELFDISPSQRILMGNTLVEDESQTFEALSVSPFQRFTFREVPPLLLCANPTQDAKEKKIKEIPKEETNTTNININNTNMNDTPALEGIVLSDVESTADTSVQSIYTSRRRIEEATRDSCNTSITTVEENSTAELKENTTKLQENNPQNVKTKRMRRKKFSSAKEEMKSQPMKVDEHVNRTDAKNESRESIHTSPGSKYHSIMEKDITAVSDGQRETSVDNKRHSRSSTTSPSPHSLRGYNFDHDNICAMGGEPVSSDQTCVFTDLPITIPATNTNTRIPAVDEMQDVYNQPLPIPPNKQEEEQEGKHKEGNEREKEREGEQWEDRQPTLPNAVMDDPPTLTSIQRHPPSAQNNRNHNNGIINIIKRKSRSRSRSRSSSRKESEESDAERAINDSRDDKDKHRVDGGTLKRAKASFLKLISAAKGSSKEQQEEGRKQKQEQEQQKQQAQQKQEQHQGKERDEEKEQILPFRPPPPLTPPFATQMRHNTNARSPSNASESMNNSPGMPANMHTHPASILSTGSILKRGGGYTAPTADVLRHNNSNDIVRSNRNHRQRSMNSQNAEVAASRYQDDSNRRETNVNNNNNKKKPITEHIRITVIDANKPERHHYNIPVDPDCPVGILRYWMLKKGDEKWMWAICCNKKVLSGTDTITFRQATAGRNDCVFSLEPRERKRMLPPVAAAGAIDAKPQEA
ncbi:hypothetical protein LSM04_009282 [Trypanosoma melophagium]|uniref:uncharacterized protein n=1 Tax=Trypanosoma melophagium TaxID=715481 RepID=UPI003519E0F6|nr:hypothetical protein LSM04_009282 [Trypanosoma melophagium]